MVQLNKDERAWVCFEMAKVQNAHAEQPRGGGGAHVKILTGMLVLFFEFEIWPNPIFLGWQII